jgi:hypothetical protein
MEEHTDSTQALVGKSTPGLLEFRPLEPSLTPFRTANPDFLLLIITGFAVLPEGYI